MRFGALFTLLVMAPLAADGTGDWSANSPKAACMSGPMAQFGRYVGDWQIADQALLRDGSGWAPGGGARWIFECIGDGTAVQDYWMPNNGGFGTNLRRYNAERDLWEIVWTAAQPAGLMQIEAKRQDDDTILMNILSPTQTPPRRIIFFPPDDEGWNWVQQQSFDEGETWIDVYKIRATPYATAPEPPADFGD